MFAKLLGLLLKRGTQAKGAARARPLIDAGIRQKEAGDHAGACRCLEEAVAADPGSAEAHHLLGVVLSHLDRAAESVAHLQRAIELEPDRVQAYDDLGFLLFLLGQHARSIAVFRGGLAVATDKAQAHHHLGLVLKDTGHRDEGLVNLREAHRISPQRGDILRSLVVALNESSRYDEALEVAKRALDSNPGWADAQRFCGYAYQNLHEPAIALAHYDEALRLGVDDAEFHGDRGVVLQDLRRLPEALESYERSLALQPDAPGVVVNRALARLLSGDYGRAWTDYEARLKTELWPVRSGRTPRWDGTSLAGRNILVYGEQGVGDQIMFASCLPEVIAAARHCTVACSPKLESLFRRSFPQATVYTAKPDEELPPPPDTPAPDVELPSGSLPLLFRGSLAQFPRHDGYLKADRQRIAYWRERLASLGGGLKVGISWRGGVHKTRRPLRSLALDQWLPVFRVPGVRFVSLQYTEGASAEAGGLLDRHGIRVEHWQEAIDDYDETAALVCALDLVISVCTAVIHLGGALGRPVWVTVPFSAEWRYGASGDTMPWYPAVRLFRQPAFGQWEPVITSVAAELARRAAGAGN